MIEEDQFHTAAAEFVDKQHLIDVGAGKPVGRMHVKSVASSERGEIAKPLQGGTDQCRTAVAVVDEAKIRTGGAAVLADSQGQCFDLAVDGAIFDLRVG
ncbi:hypothetical protein BH11PLA2_BH11PLA2_44590 [soil metagenome]